MKTPRLITLILTLTCMILPASAKDDGGHTLVRLWSEYYKAEAADKPKDQADILLKIKQEASNKRLAWDFYDATMAYVDVRSRTNWKLNAELTRQAGRDIEAFGEPVAVYFHRQHGGTGAADLLRYVRENESRLLQGHNPEFYTRDGRLDGLEYAEALLPLLANDYEYALWSLFARWYDVAVEQAATTHFAGRYPFDALLEYTGLKRRNSGAAAVSALEGYVRKHDGKAVSLLARESLLDQRRSDLWPDKGTSAQFRSLADDCERFIKDRKRFTGSEKAIADCCTRVDDILEELCGKDISVQVTDGLVTLSLRNLPQARVRILKGKEQVFERMVANTQQRFYVRDTLSFTLPAMDDGTYTLRCSEGKTEAETEYDRYSLSLAHKRDLDGYGVYVADYRTGEPVSRCDVRLLDREGKQVDEVRDLPIDGFSYLPERFSARIADDRWGYSLQAIVRDGGRVRMSQRHGFRFQERETVGTDNPARHRAMILTDRSAFNPDETVHIKVLLYEGTYAYATRPAGIRLHATLTDPTDKQVAEAELTTGDRKSVV